MPKPNVNARVREIPWVAEFVSGRGGAISHGGLAALVAGGSQGLGAFQTAFAITGGAITMFVGTPASFTTIQSQRIVDVHDSHCVYVEVFAHLRSAGNVDLPGQINVYFNDFPAATAGSVGDWVTGTRQVWEDWSSLTIPTPPPDNTSGDPFSSAGANGRRYEYRRSLGKVPGNILSFDLTNAGSVSADEFALGVIFRSSPPVYTR